jgi:hypothetical protein
LATAFVRRFERYGDRADIDAAIDAGQQALAAARPGDSRLPMYRSNLGTSLCRRFERYGDLADLDAAVEAARQAVGATPPGHPDFPTIQAVPWAISAKKIYANWETSRPGPSNQCWKASHRLHSA